MRAFLFAAVSAFLLICNVPVSESSLLRAGARTEVEGPDLSPSNKVDMGQTLPNNRLVLKGAPRTLTTGKSEGDSGRGDTVKKIKKGKNGGGHNKDCPSQDSWPDLVGETGTDAKDFIESSEPCLDVFIILEGSAVTADYSETRVRIYVDTNGIVVATPILG